MPRPTGNAVPCLLALALGAGVARAQQRIEIMPPPAETPRQDVVRPGASKRVVRVFDFEELSTNPGEVPEHWFRAQDRPGAPRPGFPSWNRAELRYTGEGAVAASGAGAVQLPTAGGSTSLLLDGGVIPVFQNADYLISAKVHTAKLDHARAAMVARFLDAKGNPIPGTQVRTPLIISNGVWKPISTELVGGAPAAAYIQLELQLLQPQQQGLNQGDASTVWPQDFEGFAWFDDVSIVQLPRIELTTSSATNITARPDKPQLKLLVRDLTGENLAIHIDVVDDQGRRADILDKKIGAGFTQTDWTPRLTRLGWYRAIMDVTTESGTRVGRSFVDFLWTAPAPSDAARDAALIADRARLGLAFTDVPAESLHALPEFVRQVGAGAVSFPVWDASLRLDAVHDRAETLRPIIDSLLGERRAVALTLGRVPAQLSESLQIEPDDPWALLAGDQKTWLPYLTPMLERFGQRINHWQIGNPGDDRALWRQDAPAEAAAISASFSKLVPGPVLGIPTRLGASWSSPDHRANAPMLVESVGPESTPQALGLALRSATPWLESGAGEVSLVVEPLELQKYGPSAGPIAAAKHAIEFWAAASLPEGRMLPGATISLADPWARVEQGRRAQLMPRPEAGVWRNLTDQLAGRRVVGSLPAGDGVVCYILAPAPGTRASRTGALVAWCDSAEAGSLSGDFGRAPLRTIDLYGNTALLPHSAVTTTNGRPRTTIPLSHAPVFIEGVDVDLIRFIAAFAIDPPQLESSNDQHERDLVIYNPWPTGISGQVTFLEPGGFETGQKNRSWRLSPRSQRFTVGPGKTERLPFKVAFSQMEEVGPKDFVLAVELAGEQSYGTIEIRRTVEVTVQNIAMDLTTTVQGPNGADLVVEAVISNRGGTPFTLELTAFAEGLPRSKTSITELTPGNQALRRFVYPGAAAKLKGQRVIVAAQDPETHTRVNKSIVIP